MCRSSCSNNNDCRCRSNNCQSNTGYTNSCNSTVYNTNGFESYSYANAYVPNQVLGTPFSPMQGLQNGTMFPELVRPYYPGQSLEEMNYLRYGRRGGCCNNG